MLCSTPSLETAKTKFDFTETNMCSPCVAFDVAAADPLKDSIGTDVWVEQGGEQVKEDVQKSENDKSIEVDKPEF